MHQKFVTIVYMCLYLLLYEVHCDKKKEGDSESDVFVPTRQWQVVKKGQPIPKGLHVRINFETGLTEAKLIDEDETKKEQALVEVPTDEDYDELDKQLLKKSVLKEALKHIQGDEILKPDDIKKIKDQFRTYEELKNDLKDLNLTPKIDAEVLQDLMKQYKNAMKRDKNVQQILRIMQDLDFLAHQFDNGIEFVNQNGFHEIIYKNLNLSSVEIKQSTLKLLGSLVQNNAKVQIHALETGAVAVLLRILSLESEVTLKNRAVTALSCLLRRFPLAQQKFVENGGLSIVFSVFQSDLTKIQVKLATLINDLLTESQHAKQTESQYELARQYRLINLENLLLEHSWCDSLNKLFFNLIVTDPDDHDSIEKCLLSMHVIGRHCARSYNKEILVNLELKYKTLAANDIHKGDEFSNSDFFTNISELCTEIIRFASENIVEHKSEL